MLYYLTTHCIHTCTLTNSSRISCRPSFLFQVALRNLEIKLTTTNTKIKDLYLTENFHKEVNTRLIFEYLNAEEYENTGTEV